MRKDFIFDLKPFLPVFSKLGLDVEFLTPTETACNKSIMDAIAPVRDFLKRNNLHDYENQMQGTDHKIFIPAFFVTENRLIKQKASLYRPITKKGDPRIWFYGLNRYCNPGDLLGLVTDKKSIYVIDLSLESIRASLLSGEYVYHVLKRLSENERNISNELLLKIKDIHEGSFVPTIISGDTGVGMTLEHILGIPPNSSKNPDYKGIELKASRTKYKHPNRVNLFSQVPDWKSSEYTAKELLTTYGYFRNDKKTGTPRFNLYCTVRANIPNPQGLYFHVEHERDLLINKSRIHGAEKEVVQWNLETLRSNLQKKHHETFWVHAESKMIDGIEHFKYNEIVHTKKPLVSLLPSLIELGVITMDYTMHRKPSGKIRDHGYLFKIKPNDIRLLFPAPISYNLNNIAFL